MSTPQEHPLANIVNIDDRPFILTFHLSEAFEQSLIKRSIVTMPGTPGFWATGSVYVTMTPVENPGDTLEQMRQALEQAFNS